MEIQAEGQHEEASEDLQEVHVAVVQRNLQQPSPLVDSNGQVRAQLGTGEVAILPVSADTSAGIIGFLFQGDKCDGNGARFFVITTLHFQCYKRLLKE